MLQVKQTNGAFKTVSTPLQLFLTPNSANMTGGQRWTCGLNLTLRAKFLFHFIRPFSSNCGSLYTNMFFPNLNTVKSCFTQTVVPKGGTDYTQQKSLKDKLWPLLSLHISRPTSFMSPWLFPSIFHQSNQHCDWRTQRNQRVFTYACSISWPWRFTVLQMIVCMSSSSSFFEQS